MTFHQLDVEARRFERHTLHLDDSADDISPT
jgi:hypothetical protein